MKQVLPLWDENVRCHLCAGELRAVTTFGFPSRPGMGAVLFLNEDAKPNGPGKSEWRPEQRHYATANFVACGTCGLLYAFEIPQEYVPRDPKKWWWQR